MRLITFLGAAVCLILSGNTFGQQTKKTFSVVDVIDAGQPQAIILKLYDADADVLCYVLMPEKAGRKMVDSGWVYDGNSIGSISCLKQRQLVVPVDANGKAISLDITQANNVPATTPTPIQQTPPSSINKSKKIIDAKVKKKTR